MKAPVRVTRDHAEIRQWAEERDGVPSLLEGRLQIAFETGLEPAAIAPPPIDAIGWDEFFRRFEAERLEFHYQDKNIEGGLSHFCEICPAAGSRAAS